MRVRAAVTRQRWIGAVVRISGVADSEVRISEVAEAEEEGKERRGEFDENQRGRERFLFTPSKTPLVSSSPPPKALTKQRNCAIRSHRLRRLSSILSSLLSGRVVSPVTGPQISNPQQIWRLCSVALNSLSLVSPSVSSHRPPNPQPPTSRPRTTLLPGSAARSGRVRLSCTILVRASAPLGSHFVLSFSPLFDLCSVVLCSHSFRASLCLIGEFSLFPLEPLFMVFFRWDDAIPEDLVRAAYDKLASTRYTALMHKLKKNRKSRFLLRMSHGGDTCDLGRARTSEAESSKRRRIGTPRSKALGTWTSKRGGGSVSFVTTQERLADSSETPPTVNDLYLHLHTVNHDRMTFIDTRSEQLCDRLQSRRQELTQATPDQSVDDEAVYLNVAGECSKGSVYGLGSVGRKKMRYGDPGASTSEKPDVVPRAEFNVVAEQLRKVMEFMQQHLGMNMDEVGLAQQQPPPPPPPPPPHDQQRPP
ncbi:hypothetical protein Syun_002088 [Stephania yunnanensis]|uniref:Uncharacterized protein n=1 Tax=Stephania yunnanensis TaxID=152371 RepID=A0AAP0LEV9_9MAGN